LFHSTFWNGREGYSLLVDVCVDNNLSNLCLDFHLSIPTPADNVAATDRVCIITTVYVHRLCPRPVSSDMCTLLPCLFKTHNSHPVLQYFHTSTRPIPRIFVCIKNNMEWLACQSRQTSTPPHPFESNLLVQKRDRGAVE
jgi:hypothetical protein